jgi:hypothetical protein
MCRKEVINSVGKKLVFIVAVIGMLMALGVGQAQATLTGPYPGTPDATDNEDIMSALLGTIVVELDKDEFNDGVPPADNEPPLIVELFSEYVADVSWDLTSLGLEAWAVAVKDGGGVGSPPPGWVYYTVEPDQRIVGGGSVDTFATFQRGAISHISLYGKRNGQVPEPAAILLIGVGLIGVAVVGRRVSKKT